MKKLFSMVLLISMLLLSSCTQLNKSITLENTGEIIKITLDNFKGSEKIKIKHENSGECSLYYKTSINKGSVDISYDQGWIWDEYPLSSISSDKNTNGGVYIDSSVKTVTIILDAREESSGEIFFCFSKDASPFK